ncbi:MAG: cell wall hydrolase [Saccharofermentans sp.]|nr:cell wall hydrolase [Saccharofermentans sp.]
MSRKLFICIVAAVFAFFPFAVLVRADENGDETEDAAQNGGALFVVSIEPETEPESEPEEGSTEYYIAKWNNCASNYERYNMSARDKAKVCGLSYEDFDFFARVVQAEGDTKGDDLTDKVLVACVIWNRLYCKKYPNTIPRVLRQRGQFEVVENGAARRRRTKDSEWAVMVGYMLVRRNDVSPHLMAFNCINYNKGYAPYFYYGGNYFSCGACTCSRCRSLEPDFHVSGYPTWTTHFKRPVLVETEEQSLEDYIMENFTVNCLTTPIDPETITPTPIPTPEPYDYDNLVIE